MPYAREKAAEFTAFLKQCWLDTYVPEVGLSSTQGLIDSMLGEGFNTLLPGRDEKAFLAFAKDKIIGSIICAERNGFLYVWGLYVGREQQRCGLGQRLIVNAMKECHEDTIVEVSVLQVSLQARAFYDKLGFREISEDTHEMGPGMYVPSLILQAPVSTILRLSHS